MIQQSDNLTEDDVKRMLMGGDANLIDAMRRLSQLSDAELELCGFKNFALRFVRDVPEKAKLYRGSLTEKQRATAHSILNQGVVVAMLVTLYAEDAASVAKSPDSENAESPKPDYSDFYANDPLYGIF